MLRELPRLSALEEELAQLIVQALHLDEVCPSTLRSDTPLYGDGLGLDSIDVLEVALLVSKHYGVSLRADDPDNQRIFQTLGSLAAHIADKRCTVQPAQALQPLQTLQHPPH